MNRNGLKVMIFILSLQSMMVMPSDIYEDQQQEQEVQGVPVDPEHEESLADHMVDDDNEGRIIDMEYKTSSWCFRIISDSRFIEIAAGILLLMAAYKWYKNDSTK